MMSFLFHVAPPGDGGDCLYSPYCMMSFPFLLFDSHFEFCHNNFSTPNLSHQQLYNITNKEYIVIAAADTNLLLSF